MLFLFCEITARITKQPTTVILTPAVIPLLPGSSIYYTMLYAIQGNGKLTTQYAKSTLYAGLGIAMGAKSETFAGLSGIGDLIVTCASMHSRNRRAGILIGKGATMEEAMKEVKMVVEGVYSAKAGYALSQKYQVSMPIIEQVNQVLFEGKAPAEAVKELMLRDKKVENIDLRQLNQSNAALPW